MNNTPTDYEMNYIDVDNQRSQKVTSFKDLVLIQYDRCQIAGSDEMARGGKRTLIMDGIPRDILTADNISKFSQSVKTLRTSLAPKLKIFLEKHGKKEHIVELQKDIKDLKESINMKIREGNINSNAIHNKYTNVNIDNISQKIDSLTVEYYMKIFELLVYVLEDLRWLDERRRVAE